MSPTRPLLALSLLVASLATPALAQPATEDSIILDTITIIGTGLPTEVMTNPASVTLIGGAALARQAAVTIAGLLRDIPGLQISEEGIERISLRGEHSRRIAILIDGQALSDHGNYGQPIPVDPTMIERIEVVRGSSSVVSGNRAIGGVINIITRKGADVPFELTTTAGWISATRGWRASATAGGTLALGAGEFDYRLGFGRMEQGDRHTPDGVAENTASSDRTLLLHTGYRLGDHYFGLRGQATDLSAGVYSGNPDFFVNLPRRDLRKVALFYEGTGLTPWLDRLTVDAYRQTVARLFENDSRVPAGPLGVMKITSESNDHQLTWGARAVAEMHFSGGSRTVAGIEYEDDRLEADKLSGRQPPGAPAMAYTSTYDEAAIRTLSVFAEHEIGLSPGWTATFGGRWYRVRAAHEASTRNGVPQPTEGDNRSSLALGSAGLVWSPDDTLALRANVSQGYIYPTLGQLFLTTTADGNTIEGNPGLKPERATTWELGARLSRGGAQLDATLFYTDARDYIAYFFPAGQAVAQYENVDRARTWGLEIQGEYASKIWDLTPYASLALLRRELRFANGFRTTDSGAPSVSGRVGVRKSWFLAGADIEADLFLRGESAATLRGSDGEVNNKKQASGWATLNLAANIRWDNGVSLVAEFTNVTNRSYRPYEQAPGAERGVSLFLTKSF